MFKKLIIVFAIVLGIFAYTIAMILLGEARQSSQDTKEKIGITRVNAQTPPKKNPANIITFSYVSKSMSVIQMKIDELSKQGYRVKFLVSQSVSISYPSSTGSQYYKEIYGDILLVMEK